jgi:hypothetical protein
MLDLISRLESAAEGSRELSDDVLLACGWEKTFDGVACDYWAPPHTAGRVYSDNRPSPTESVDDALELVPEGWTWCGSGYDEDGGYSDTTDFRKPYMCIAGPMEERGGDFYEPPEPHRETHEARAATPALALCAAILRATTEDKE